MAKKPYTFRLEETLMQEVEKIAKDNYKDKTEVITEAIVKYLKTANKNK